MSNVSLPAIPASGASAGLQQQHAQRDAVSVAAASGRWVVALAPVSRDAFARVFDPELFPSVDWHWLNLGDLSGPRGWGETLARLEPSVVVTGWGTPSLAEPENSGDTASLRYVCHLAGGVKQLVPRRLIERGVLVSNWGQSISHTIAEHAVLLVLGLLRNLPAWNSAIERWPVSREQMPIQMLGTRSLRGKRVGLHGFGAIAREISRMLQPFGVRLSAYSAGVPASLFEECDVARAATLEELFSGSDVLIECEALTPRTRLSVTERLLRLLPQDAVFVNVGRGAVVDEEALIRVAKEGRLRVGMDVYQQEPISAEFPLYEAPNVLLSPHIAGPTEDALPVICEFAVHNLQRYLNGEQPEGLVSLDIYDRST